MSGHLDTFLDLWIPATQHGTYRCIAWWEGGFGVDNKQEWLPVGEPEADKQLIRDRVLLLEEVFFYASTFSRQSTKEEYAERSGLLWLDLDHADPRNLPVLPSLSWETSENNYQALWVLDQALEPGERKDLNRGLYEACKDLGADPSYDASRRLRLPGTVNRKPGRDEAPVLLVERTGQVYAPSRIPRPEQTEHAPDTGGPPEGPEDRAAAERILSAHKAPTGLMVLWRKPAPKGERSGQMMRLLLQLSRLGLSAEDMFTVARVAPANKWRRYPARLWAEIHKTREKYPSKVQPKTKGELWPTYGVEDLLQYDQPLQWAIRDYWPQGACGMIYGLPGSRKSWMAAHLAVCTLTGEPFFAGRETEIEGPVYYHTLDDPPRVFFRHVKNIAASKGYDINDLPLHWSDRGFSFLKEGWEAQVRANIAATGAVLYFIDGLYLTGYDHTAHGSNLVDLMHPLKVIASEPPYPSFCVVHHSVKTGDPSADVRIGGAGSTFLLAWQQVAWRMETEVFDKDKRQVVLFSAGVKEGSKRPPILRLTYGTDEEQYEVEEEEAIELEARIMAALAGGSKDESKLYRLLRSPIPKVKTALKELEERGLIESGTAKIGKGKSWSKVEDGEAPESFDF